MHTLFSFYHSREWVGLLRTLKLERLNADGYITCEYCGKPIVRAYDIIGHHKVELTEENVNDYVISLNPENVAFVHHACHNRIHNKLGHKVREVFLVYGAPLSGKTTWVKENMSQGDLVVDMDSIWECISAQQRYVKPTKLNPVAFRMRDTLIDCIEYRVGNWNCAYLIGGYPLQSERERLCKSLGAREVFIDISMEECMARIEGSGRDANEWRRYIEQWFSRFQGAG